MICPRASGLQVCRKFIEDTCENRYVVSKDEFADDSYPPHCHGYAYVLHRDLVKKILHKDKEFVEDKRMKRFRMEDVYVTGILVREDPPQYLDIQ